MVEAPSLLIPIAPQAREPLQEQIYRGLRDAILCGRLAPGARLPSTRTLAGDLAVARITVVPAIGERRRRGGSGRARAAGVGGGAGGGGDGDGAVARGSAEGVPAGGARPRVVPGGDLGI